ncbi:MAG: zinc-ribbon domain-containing protein [Candidatus Bathyarchaeota archaeon]|nr:zinc-ribbon domain-containing protein [Candidatus Bathyarchaeota archaeon]
MPYCKKCGAKLSEGEKFCSACGTPVTEPVIRYERQKRRSSRVRILPLVFGGIILLVAMGLLVGGGALLWINTSLIDNEDFITTKSYPLDRDSYAITFQQLNIDIDEVVGTWGVWRPSPSDLVTIKITVSSNDPSKNVFLGIGEKSDVEAYLFDVYYDEVITFSISPSQTISVEFNPHPGDSVTSEPASQTFWTVSEHGVGTQILEWSPEEGDYWFVLMNEDGSAGVDMNIALGVKIPLLSTISVALLAGGVVALLIGGFLIYFGIRR